MAIKNYYVVLGVHREESETGIRTAYKGLAKKLHPDRIGEHGTKAFQELVEAYQTLSDPEKRRSHNHLLDQEEHRRRQTGQNYVRRELEPRPFHWRKVSTMESYRSAPPSFEDRYRRVPRNSKGMGVSRAEWTEGLNFEVFLSADEASRGGVVSVDVPTSCPCFACGGSGRDWMFPCFDCQGLGLIGSRRTANIRFPPGIRSGTVIEVPLWEGGTENPYLRLYMVVD